MPAQPLDDLHALGYRRAEVPGAFHQITLVDIVGAHADLDQVLHQSALNVHAVVDACQQHALVAQGHARPAQPVASIGQFLGDLVGVVDMDVHPHGVVLLDHVAELGGDALRHEHGYAAADANDLDVGDLAQAAQQLFQLLGGQGERVAA